MTVRKANGQDNQIIVGDPIADIGRQIIVGDPIRNIKQPSRADGASQSIAPGEPNPNAAGPLSLQGQEGKDAIQASLNYLNGPGRSLGINNPSKELVARSAERDEFGMTHVRLDRVYN